MAYPLEYPRSINLRRLIVFRRNVLKSCQIDDDRLADSPGSDHHQRKFRPVFTRQPGN